MYIDYIYDYVDTLCCGSLIFMNFKNNGFQYNTTIFRTTLQKK